MRTYITADNVGTRSVQCDATAIHTAPDGARAYVLLDGIGESDEVRDWVRIAARRLARAASRRGDAEAGLRRVYDRYAAERADYNSWSLHYEPKAAAVVVVVAPGKPVTVAWCGDSRAYAVSNGVARKLTDDHNLRRVYPASDLYPQPGNRNVITSCLGSVDSDEDVKAAVGHPAIETATLTNTAFRLVLASDGAYEPHEDAAVNLAEVLAGDRRTVARRFVDDAVTRSTKATRAAKGCPYADNATVLIADVT